MTVPYPYSEPFRESVRASLAGFERSAEAESASLKRACVGIVLVETREGSGEAAFLLTQRAPTLRSHGGQFALPGGRAEQGETPIETVLREVKEELALALDAEDVLGILDDYPTRSGYIITPVVVWAGNGDSIEPNPGEVSEVHRIDLHQIMAADSTHFISIPESDRPVIRILINGVHVHAPTAALLYQFRELLHGRQTRVAELEQPVFAWR